MHKNLSLGRLAVEAHELGETQASDVVTYLEHNSLHSDG